MRNIIALLLIVASIGVFFGYIKPTYSTIQDLQNQDATYDDSLVKIQSLNDSIVKDNKTIKSFSADDIDRLNKFLPDGIDNVKLIIELMNTGSDYGLAIKGIALDQSSVSGGQTNTAPVQTAASKQGYNSVNVSFNVTASYENFLIFIKGLERNLRLVDITSISFTPSSDKGDVYNFHVALKTYWLK